MCILSSPYLFILIGIRVCVFLTSCDHRETSPTIFFPNSIMTTLHLYSQESRTVYSSIPQKLEVLHVSAYSRNLDLFSYSPIPGLICDIMSLNYISGAIRISLLRCVSGRANGSSFVFVLLLSISPISLFRIPASVEDLVGTDQSKLMADDRFINSLVLGLMMDRLVGIDNVIAGCRLGNNRE